MPFLAISIVILFVFMLLYTFVFSDKKEGGHLHKGVQITLGILFSIALVCMIVFASGYWDNVYHFLFEREGASQLWVNVFCDCSYCWSSC
jgi:NADH:ubiquinone oxidoreductase subunit 6 (subunit J)